MTTPALNVNKDDGYPKIPLGEYLVRRLLSIGSKSAFGVPGDFNLPLLEFLYNKDGDEIINWIGCCNELNASYAADGYSRYTNKIGCLITTYGVGELSAINGITGSYAENIKILHIVGVAPTFISEDENLKYKNLHHLIPDKEFPNINSPNFKIYYQMVKDKISCASEYLTDIETSCDKIDDVIVQIFKHSKPGYIFIPSDFSNKLVSSKNLINVPSINLSDCLNKTPMEKIDNLTNEIIDLIGNSQSPAIIGDVLTDRFGCTKLLNDFIQMTKFWNFSTMMGKSVIDESGQAYMGTYIGLGGLTTVYNKILKCDIFLIFGLEMNEMNSGNYSFKFPKGSQIIEINPNYLKITKCHDTENQIVDFYPNVSMTHILEGLIAKVNIHDANTNYDKSVKSYDTSELVLPLQQEDEEKITQVHLQRELPNFLNPGDVLVCETGSFQFAVQDFKFPSNLKYISQGFYLSIGMALPAALGVGIAMKDYPKFHLNDHSLARNYTPRLILLEGDGAAQMTVQELTTMLRHKIPMEIFLWNNNGYTVERAIEGPFRSYNDIMPWNWTKLLNVLGDPNNEFNRCVTIDKKSQLSEKFKELKEGKDNNCIQLIEVQLDTHDIPRQLDFMVQEMTFKKKSSSTTEKKVK
ncbi:hypothetical protein Kpol_440p4 [Vanderwaltozyma polyspora DSM 70294]|uniref:Pyruvate decarboxylase n=1 Tax=Vanderwaltozyma polyspora (strain ATCC 22028 / DSM 70294 / BCRC 21397 / CBS 2163 / NBRC 10782 / NRRL Y-8283 / UCD 57-17) TaxID=436907 RepID=A7TRE3_VANPO|nr:uncharacterized protein Kpol_440p4 [Vanderwaltozyma polyspora DSM 70294]EDO15157.1 hypothetical protein Kpol_440p4 [Vanderwaltozyma polyspora DSM 70294]